jgi:hypothetical protein
MIKILSSIGILLSAFLLIGGFWGNYKSIRGALLTLYDPGFDKRVKLIAIRTMATAILLTLILVVLCYYLVIWANNTWLK